MNSFSTLGTLHDLFLSNSKYGLNEFASAIYQFQPDVIFSEVRVGLPDVVDACIDGGIEQAIVYAYADENGIPIIATDWFDADFIREMIEEYSNIDREVGMQLQEMMTEYQNCFASESLQELHSSSQQDKIRNIYKMYETYNLVSARKRNEQIVANIKSRLSSFQNKKILIIYGMDHKYFIDDHLQTEGRILDVLSWYSPGSADRFQFSEILKNKTIENLEKSQKALAQRLHSQHYP